MKAPGEKKYRRAIKLYEVDEVQSMTNLLNRNKCFESGELPLTLAAAEGHEAVVEKLVKGGANVNKLDKHGRAPLHIAVQINDEETVDILLGSRADLNKYDGYNMTPLHIACERGYKNMVQKLLRAGANSNEDKRALSPLVHAALRGHTECVEELLAHGADPNVADARGSTSLYIAVQNRDVELTKLLLKHGAQITPPSKDHDTLLCLAALSSSPEIVSALTAAGCDPNSHKDDDVPPLIAATARANPDTADALLDAGARVDVADKKGNTPLFLAAMAVADVDREVFYCKYFSNVYRMFSKYDPLDVFPENSTKCAMSLVQAGADVTRTWERFAVVFPSVHGVSFEQMVLCEVLIQAYGFQKLSKEKTRNFVNNLLAMREYGLVKLLFSAGVNPESEDLYLLSTRSEDTDRAMFKYVKRLRFRPRQLKDLCRKKVREHLSWNVLYLVDHLAAPGNIKEYICIMDTEHYSQVDES